jgi:dolichol-phosphate mannosyltransferase
MNRLIRFALVGVVGAGVHMASFEAANRLLGIEAAKAWLVGFALAATATWSLNRLTTFADRRSRRAPGEWALYLAIAVLGAVAHFLVFRLITTDGAWLSTVPALGVVPGSIASFAVTYVGASLLVFPKVRNRP